MVTSTQHTVAFLQRKFGHKQKNIINTGKINKNRQSKVVVCTGVTEAPVRAVLMRGVTTGAMTRQSGRVQHQPARDDGLNEPTHNPF